MIRLGEYMNIAFELKNYRRDCQLGALGDAYAVLANKTVLPRRMFVFHMLAVQLVMALIPDVRQTLDAQVSTWDFVLSQGSGNAGLLIWMAANARWADRQIKMKEANGHE